MEPGSQPSLQHLYTLAASQVGSLFGVWQPAKLETVVEPGKNRVVVGGGDISVSGVWETCRFVHTLCKLDDVLRQYNQECSIN